MSNTLKSQIFKILWITLGWTFISIFHFFTVYANLISLGCDIADLNPWLYFKGSLFTGLMAGVVGGSGMVFYWEKLLRTQDYGWSVRNILWTYTVIYVVVSITIDLFVVGDEQDLPFYHTQVWRSVISGVFNITSFQSYFLWLFIVLGTLIVLLVNDKYGPGVFRDFLLGRYFQPKREERIFMFLDLRLDTFKPKKIGDMELRGKKQKVVLYTL